MLKKIAFASCIVCVCYSPALAGDPIPARKALQPFNNLIGSWEGTAIPKSADEKKRGFWVETVSWEWRFRDKDAWLIARFDKGRYYTKGELRYLPKEKQYELELRTADSKKHIFKGALADKKLKLVRTTDTEKQRIIITLLHANRFLYSYSTCPVKRSLYRQQYLVGATRKGVAFAKGDGQPECIVSGGLGTIAVSHKGKTYYVCCGGCRTEFEANPEFYIKEYNAKKKTK